jgi:hypothetical protein
MPTVERSIANIGFLIEKLAPLLVQRLTSAVIQSIPNLVNATISMVIGIGNGLYEGFLALFAGKTTELASVTASAINQSVEAQGKLTKAVEATNKAQSKTLLSFDKLNKLTDNAASNISSGGISMPQTSIIGGISTPNEQSAKKTTDWLGRIAELIRQTSGKIKEYLGEFDFSKTIKGLKNFVSFFDKVWKSVAKTAEKWGAPIRAKLKQLNDKILETITPVVAWIQEQWEWLGTTLNNIWDEYGDELSDKFGQTIDSINQVILDLWDNTISPLVMPLIDEFIRLWEQDYKPLFNELGSFLVSLADGIMILWNTVLAPFISWLSKVLSPAFAFAGKLMAGVFGTIQGAAADAARRVMEYLGGVLDFISGVFTGNWEKAWSGIKKSFLATWEAIKDGVKAPINLIIDYINALIAGLNKVQIDIPDPLGGGSYGFNISTIPKLAQGTVVPPNREFVAVLGDNKREPEIVSPLSTMKQSVKEALAEMGSGTIHLNVYLDGDIVYQTVIDRNNANIRRTGKNALAM